jgi:hypothetical protein
MNTEYSALLVTSGDVDGPSRDPTKVVELEEVGEGEGEGEGEQASDSLPDSDSESQSTEIVLSD